MATSKSSNMAPDPMASKLLEADSELAVQEAQLAAQIEALQEKRKSLQTVIHLFGSTNGQMAVSAPSVSAQPSANGFVAEPPTLPSSKATSTDVTSDPKRKGRQPSTTNGNAAKASSKSAVTQTATQPGRKSSSTKADVSATASKKASKPVKESTDWQPYVRKEYQDRSLPKAVLAVLQDHPNQVVEVPKIIDSIFVDTIPKPARTNARDRLSNVLSVGLKNKKWFRGKTGEYSVSKEAAAMSIAS